MPITLAAERWYSFYLNCVEVNEAISRTVSGGCDEGCYPSGDLNCDRYVDWKDLGQMYENWLKTGVCLREDLNDNGLVNAVDFAEFAGFFMYRQE